VAVIVLLPVVVEVSEHVNVPPDTVHGLLTTVPSVTVTEEPIVPDPDVVTVPDTVYACPMTVAVDREPVIVVVVLALKVAVTDWALLPMPKLQGPVPVHPAGPAQPAKVDPEPAVWVIVMLSVFPTFGEHGLVAVVHEKFFVLSVESVTFTVPVPAPVTVTVSIFAAITYGPTKGPPPPTGAAIGEPVRGRGSSPTRGTPGSLPR